MTDDPNALRVVIVCERGFYVAQCVDFDVAGHSSTPEQALDAFVKSLIRRVLVARKLDTKPLDGVGPPPPEYLRMWEEAAGSGTARPFQIPGFEIAHGEPVHSGVLPREGRYALVA